MDDRTHATRADLLEGIEQLRQNDLIDADDENELVRHVDQQRQSIEDALAKIGPEYQRRLAADGQASADRWLAQAARELGERDGASSRRMIDQLSFNG